MMKTMIRTAGAASVLALAVASASAIANPFGELFFSQNAGWAFVDPDDGVLDKDDPDSRGFDAGSTGLSGLNFDDATSSPAPANTFATMSWDGSNGLTTSSITITSFDSEGSPEGLKFLSDANGDLDIDAVDGSPNQWNEGDWWVIDQLTQRNEILTSASTTIPDPLWRNDTIANLFIHSDAGRTALDLVKEDTNSRTTIEFWESLNNDSGCVANLAPLGTVCDDIFRIAAAELDPISATIGGFKYTFKFDLLPGPSFGIERDLDENGDEVVQELGPSLVCVRDAAVVDGCSADTKALIPVGEIWTFTPEADPDLFVAGTSSLFVLMSYEISEVPEPSVLALFGLGLLGMGFAGRRRRQS